MSEIYAKENDGIFPPLSPVPGRLLYDFDDETIAFVSDHFCDCPDHNKNGSFEMVKLGQKNGDAVYQEVIKFVDYIYLGYALESEEQFLEFFKTYQANLDAGKNFADDLTVEEGKGTCGGNTLKRLYLLDHVKADCYKANASKIPVAIEWPRHHKRGNYFFNTPFAKVAFLDGHTEKIDYPGKFPMTPIIFEGLRKLASQYHPERSTLPIE